MNTVTIGQCVAWTKVTKKGKTIEFKRCDGIVASVNDQEASAVIIEGKQRHTIPIAEMRTPEEYTEIRDVIEAMKSRIKEQPHE